MRRTVPAVVLLVLVVVAPLTAATGTGGAPADSDASQVRPAATAALANETRLGLDGRARYNYSDPGLSFGATVAGVDGELRTRYRRELVEARVAAAPDARAALYVRAAADLEAEVDALRASERAAVRQYANGSISATELTRRLARYHAHAVALERSVRALRLTTNDEAAQGSLRDLSGRVETLQSPVRAFLLQSIRGAGDTPEVFVAATENGVVLGAVHDGRFYREAVRYDNRRPDQPPSVTTPGEAIDRIGELYPETETGGDAGVSGLRRFPGQQLFRIEIDHAAGPTQAYLDMATGRVFSEHKSKSLAALEPVRAVNQSNEELRVVVNRTGPTGAMEVRVYDADTGAVVDADLRIGGEVVGETGADGRLWLVEPPRTYELTATRGGDVITVTVSPVGTTVGG